MKTSALTSPNSYRWLALGTVLSPLIFLTSTPRSLAVGFSYTSPVSTYNIPDNNTTGVSADQTIGSTDVINDLTVTINGLNHTWLSDLIASLTNVTTGTTVTLFNRPGAGQDLNGNYSFNNSFTGSLTNASDPVPSGNYSPSQSLAAFNGQSLAGKWRLTISDRAPEDIGSFQSFTLSGDASPILTDVPATAVPFEFSPSLGLVALGGIFGANKLRKKVGLVE